MAQRWIRVGKTVSLLVGLALISAPGCRREETKRKFEPFDSKAYEEGERQRERIVAAAKKVGELSRQSEDLAKEKLDIVKNVKQLETLSDDELQRCSDKLAELDRRHKEIQDQLNVVMAEFDGTSTEEVEKLRRSFDNQQASYRKGAEESNKLRATLDEYRKKKTRGSKGNE